MPSSGVASATEVSTSPVAGFSTSKVFPDDESRHSPPMWSCVGRSVGRDGALLWVCADKASSFTDEPRSPRH